MEDFTDFTKCVVCLGFFKHIVLRDDNMNIVKHITACSRCIILLEKKRRLLSHVLDVDYRLFVRRDNNM